MAIKSVRKGEFLLRQGDISSKFFVVHAGLLRSYCIDNKGKEHIFMFAPEGWIAVDSKAPDARSDLFIDAIEDSKVEVLDKKVVFNPLASEDEVHVTRLQFARRLEALQTRIVMLMSATAIDRYEYFLKTYPNIACRVPQKMIASYLGITPEALSKVKNLKARSK